MKEIKLGISKRILDMILWYDWSTEQGNNVVEVLLLSEEDRL